MHVMEFGATAKAAIVATPITIGLLWQAMDTAMSGDVNQLDLLGMVERVGPVMTGLIIAAWFYVYKYWPWYKEQKLASDAAVLRREEAEGKRFDAILQAYNNLSITHSVDIDKVSQTHLTTTNQLKTELQNIHVAIQELQSDAGMTRRKRDQIV